MENEMMAMPVVIVLIVGTAFLTAIVSASLPRMGKWFNALKSRIKREKNATDIVDIIIISKLTERIDELEEQLTNLAEVKYNRDKNRINNIRRDVREYLKELQNTK
tara:strand:+ start:315 stop:632 length:318 start_codon:yes stop_codon:yes gene_type:complete